MISINTFDALELRTNFQTSEVLLACCLYFNFHKVMSSVPSNLLRTRRNSNQSKKNPLWKKFKSKSKKKKSKEREKQLLLVGQTFVVRIKLLRGKLKGRCDVKKKF